jgi:hypothetical protein
MNPFTERSRITNPAHFIGRWREVSLTFERLEQRRPAMISGPAGIGKSSLITHIAQSAATVLELPDLQSLFLDLALLPDAATCLGLITRSLGGVGSSLDDLQLALIACDHTVLISLDGADAAIAAGWGEGLLESLARLARRSVPTYPGGLAPPGAGAYDLLLLAAAGATQPALSEPFGGVSLGALAVPEQRMLCEAYLDSEPVAFSTDELHELGRLSAGHPAYLQRAAYHLYIAHTRPGYGWRAAYLAEAREAPIPGAPLPPAIFSGEGGAGGAESSYGELAEGEGRHSAPPRQIEGLGSLAAALLPLVAGLIALLAGGGWLAFLAVAALGYALAALALRRRR